MCEEIFIETSQLIIKTISQKYFNTLRFHQKDPYIMRFFGGPREDSKIEATLNLLSNHLNKYGFSQGPVFIKETGECIGRAGLVHLDLKPTQDVELGIFLLKPYSSKGYATELGEALIRYAFDTLGAPRVFGTIDPQNIEAYRVVEKLGMSFVREDVYETLGKTVKFYVKNKR